jgi:hypothetical protein
MLVGELAATLQRSEILIECRIAAFARTASITSTSNDLAGLEVNDKQEWEILDITGREDINGLPHY